MRIQNKSKNTISNAQIKFFLFAICKLCLFWILCFGAFNSLYAQDVQENKGEEKKPIANILKAASEPSDKTPPKEPIIVNGDKIEYSTDKREVVVTGNAEVIHKGSKLTCQKLTLNTQTKDGLAEGDARLDDQKAIIEGSKIDYNFETKRGTIIDSEFRSNPYFGRTDKVEKVSDAEFRALNGYVTTCSFEHPHYRIGLKRLNFFPKDKIQMRGAKIYIGDLPIMYLPAYDRSLKGEIMHVQAMPGKHKQWGYYLLTTWKHNLRENINARLYLDYRQDLGIAEGFGLNYNRLKVGSGDFKFYYTQERNKSSDFPEEDVSIPKVFQRYLVRWRHKWEIDESTNFISEYHKIVDSKRAVHPGGNFDFLKEYFFREFEKDTQPLSYVSLHHSFIYSSMDFIIQPRVNRWYTQLVKLPEIDYSLPSIQIMNTPFYFDNSTQAAYFLYKHAVPSPSSDDIVVGRVDTNNRLSLPTKVGFIQLTPFVKIRGTYYTHNVYGAATVFRTIFYSGVDMSTKFYRIFNLNTNFLGLDINGLRHIITPTIGYAYNRQPTIPNSKLKQIDSIDSISRNNSAGIGLSNKLQTKRKGESVDLVDFRVNTSYIFKPKVSDERGSNFSDIVFNLDIRPYSWLRILSDATYRHSGSHSDENYNTFTNVNYNFDFNFTEERSIGIGQRYQRKGGNEVTYNLEWRLNPKWKFAFYHRRQLGHDPRLKRGIREQQYTISRDLHCWEMDLTYNVQRGQGENIMLVFRLKAFPETEFGLEQSYHQPKSGSQSNP